MAVPPDVMAALQGGGAPQGAPAGPPGGGLPPELLAALGQGGAPSAPAPEQGSGDNVDFLNQAIDAAQQYVDGEDDEIHKQTVLQCIAKLQSILADEQKMSDSMLGGKIEPRQLRKMGAGQSY